MKRICTYNQWRVFETWCISISLINMLLNFSPSTKIIVPERLSVIITDIYLMGIIEILLSTLIVIKMFI